jgi:hypothetical protein
MATATFKVTVFRSSGQPFPGAILRLIANEQDALPGFVGLTPPIKTDNEGKFSYSYPTHLGFPLGPLAAGVYAVTASSPGYVTASVDTPSNFVGNGTFSLTLEVTPIDTGYEVVMPEVVDYSAMLPISVQVEAPDDPSNGFRVVRCEIEANGNSSFVGIVPDENNLAVFGIEDGIVLKPAFHAVADGDLFRTDPDFSTTALLSFRVETANGTADLEDTISIAAANFLPGGVVNDLMAYRSVPYKWITPMKTVVIVFSGYYADVLIWPRVSMEEEADLRLLRVDYDNAGEVLETSLYGITAGIFSNGQAAKVRLVTPDNDAITSAYSLVLDSDGSEVSEVLTVIYR